MSNLPTNANRDAAYPEEPGQANELNELRSLLIGPDLKGRFENAQLRSEDVSRVLPEAIQLTLKNE